MAMTAEASGATITSTAVKRSSVSHCSRRVSTRPSEIGGHELARREVVEHHDAAGLDQVGDRVEPASWWARRSRGTAARTGPGRAASTSRRRAPRPGGRRAKISGGRLGQLGVELGGEDAWRPAAYAGAQPRRTDAAAGAELGHRAGAGGGQRGEQPAGLVAAEGDVAGPAGDVEARGDDRRAARGVRSWPSLTYRVSHPGTRRLAW